MTSQSVAVAVVAMAGRFPGANSIEKLWDNLRQGKHSIRFFSRRELEEAGVSETEIENPHYVPAAAPMEDPDLFDAEYFGYSAEEAESIDPQQRLFLECAVHALESAAIDPTRPPGRIGVFAGSALSPYLLYNTNPVTDSAFSKNNMAVGSRVDKDFLATRVSYKLDLRGPSVTVQTACSTSLVAVHIACRSLMSGDCDVALAGGVSVLLGKQKAGYVFTPGGVLSKDGLCRPFDALASGTVFGDGLAVAVLRRLADAEASGDRILAVIRGSAINNDGGSKMAFAAPSAAGQAVAIEEALASAELSPCAIDYVEAHGTGTPVGDRIEVRALGRVWSKCAAADRRCLLGSIKSNIGHLNTAAGIAGFVKAVLVARYGIVPPTAHFERPHKTLPLDTTRFAVPREAIDLPASDQPYRTAVSSFGIGGTNAHVVLEQYRGRPRRSSHRRLDQAGHVRPQVLPVSAKTKPALDQLVDAVIDRASTAAPDDIAELARSLGEGRTAHALRQYLTVNENGDVRKSEVVAVSPRAPADVSPSALVLVLGSELDFDVATLGRLARSLSRAHPQFAGEFEQCLNWGVRASFQSQGASLAIDDILEAGLPGLNAAVLAAFCFAAVRQLQYWGIEPLALAGIGLGEYVAAGLSGVLDREDVMRIVTRRAELMALVPEGAMMWVPLPASAVFGCYACDLDLAVSSAPGACILSGPKIRVEAFRKNLQCSGIRGEILNVPCAAHSRSMLAIRKPCEDLFSGVVFRRVGTPFLSGVTGDWHTRETLTANYWGRHLTETMRFDEGLRRIEDELKPKAFVLLDAEAGSGRLVGNVLGHDASKVIEAFTPGSSHSEGGLLDVVGKAWQLGGEINWLDVTGAAARAEIPHYPFQSRSHWLQRGNAGRDLQTIVAPEEAEP